MGQKWFFSYKLKHSIWQIQKVSLLPIPLFLEANSLAYLLIL